MSDHIAQLHKSIAATPTLKKSGYISRLRGLLIESTGLAASLGDTCTIKTAQGRQIAAEVVGINTATHTTQLMPYQEPRGIAGGDPVSRKDGPLSIPVGKALIGRVINTWGVPIDNKSPLTFSERRSVYPRNINPLERALISQQMVSGIRSIDAFVPIGCGQRLGIFSGSGVGKSVLMGMMARNTTADVNVIALVGERSREVREFIDNELGAKGLQRSVLVVSTSELPPLARLRAAYTALTVAEYFRDCGQQVLLFFDSVTRFAMAQREIGLSIGEPPTTRGYPPSVFSLLPQILERCGATEQGSITGIFSVLVEGDDLEEPISDALHGLLDGHVVLSRRQAQRNFYPAVDILRLSLSLRTCGMSSRDDHRRC